MLPKEKNRQFDILLARKRTVTLEVKVEDTIFKKIPVVKMEKTWQKKQSAGLGFFRQNRKKKWPEKLDD